MSFTNIQKEVLEGCLLGDGHIEKGKHSKNACFRYTSSSKEHTEYVHNFLKEFCTEHYQTVKQCETFDSRTNKTYVSYRFRTRCLPEFTDLHTKWYTPKKIVPKDLQLTKYSLLLWYIGDGSLNQGEYIKLCTDSFTKEEVLFLCSLLKEYEGSLLKHGSAYRVYIPRRKVKAFLSFIEDCPFSEYAHKWKIKPYKNLNIEQNGVTHYSLTTFLEIEKQVKTTTKTLYSLSKEYKVPLGSIRNYLDKNQINWERIISKKPILQYDLLGNFIKEWNSGQEVKQILNYNASAISECCRNVRKHYKNYIWKFKNV